MHKIIVVFNFSVLRSVKIKAVWKIPHKSVYGTPVGAEAVQSESD